MNVSQMNAPSTGFLTWDHPPKIHIVEHDAVSMAAIEAFLRRQGFTIQCFRDGESFMKAAAEETPDIVLLNIHLPGIGGIETITRFKKLQLDSSVIFLSDENTADTCAQAARFGTYDIILKPFQKTCLTTAIRNALQKRDLAREMEKLKAELRVRYDFTSIIGSTPAITRMVATLKRLASSDVPVLLHGGKGSGKELAARTIHYNSRFAEGPFICVNCSVLRSGALESEVFSSLRGSSSSRGNSNQEKWLRAKGGTLFLDDITDMDLSLLNKLLNRLKSRANFQPGGNKGAPMDFRIICGTREDIGAGGTDLEEHTEFFRLLAPFQVKIPSLRNRTGDIPLLIKHFLNEIVHEDENHHQTIPNVTPEAMKILMAYPWPGNIRELKNVIHQTVLLHDSGRIGPEDLPPSIHDLEGDAAAGLNGPDFDDGVESGWDLNEAGPENQPLENDAMNESTEENQSPDTGPGKKKEKAPFLTLRESESRLIRQALEYTNWNMKRTASLLGLSRPALYRRIEKLKITRGNPPPAQPDENNPSSSGEPGSGESGPPPHMQTEAAAGVSFIHA